MPLETAIDEQAAPTLPASVPSLILESEPFYRNCLSVGHDRTCDCKPNHLNCLTAKEWIKSQLGVWQFNYERRDIRDKKTHPATFPHLSGPPG